MAATAAGNGPNGRLVRRELDDVADRVSGGDRFGRAARHVFGDASERRTGAVITSADGNRPGNPTITPDTRQARAPSPGYPSHFTLCRETLVESRLMAEVDLERNRPLSPLPPRAGGHRPAAHRRRALRWCGSTGTLRPIHHPELTSDEIAGIVRRLLGPDLWTTFGDEMEVDFSFSWRDLARFRATPSHQRGSAALSLRLIPTTIPTSSVGLPALFAARIPNCPAGSRAGHRPDRIGQVHDARVA